MIFPAIFPNSGGKLPPFDPDESPPVFEVLVLSSDNSRVPVEDSTLIAPRCFELTNQEPRVHVAMDIFSFDSGLAIAGNSSIVLLLINYRGYSRASNRAAVEQSLIKKERPIGVKGRESFHEKWLKFIGV